MRRSSKISVGNNYESGREYASSCYDRYVNTGYSGATESAIYVEAVAKVIKDGSLQPELHTSLLKDLKRHKKTKFYDGIVDFLIEKIKGARLEQVTNCH